MTFPKQSFCPFQLYVGESTCNTIFSKFLQSLYNRRHWPSFPYFLYIHHHGHHRHHDPHHRSTICKNHPTNHHRHGGHHHIDRDSHQMSLIKCCIIKKAPYKCKGGKKGQINSLDFSILVQALVSQYEESNKVLHQLKYRRNT